MIHSPHHRLSIGKSIGLLVKRCEKNHHALNELVLRWAKLHLDYGSFLNEQSRYLKAEDRAEASKVQEWLKRREMPLYNA